MRLVMTFEVLTRHFIFHQELNLIGFIANMSTFLWWNH